MSPFHIVYAGYRKALKWARRASFGKIMILEMRNLTWCFGNDMRTERVLLFGTLFEIENDEIELAMKTARALT